MRPSPALPPAAFWSRRRVALQVATVLLAVGFGYLTMRNVRFSQAWHALQTSNYWWLIPAFGAFVVATLMRAMRWRALFARGRRPARGPVIAATMIGYLFNNIMPARAGEAARVVALNQRAGTPPAEIVGTVVVERAYDVLSILIIFFCAAPWLPRVSWLARPRSSPPRWRLSSPRRSGSSRSTAIGRCASSCGRSRGFPGSATSGSTRSASSWRPASPACATAGSRSRPLPGASGSG